MDLNLVLALGILNLSNTCASMHSIGRWSVILSLFPLYDLQPIPPLHSLTLSLLTSPNGTFALAEYPTQSSPATLMSHTKVWSHTPIHDMCTAANGELVWTTQDGNAYIGHDHRPIDIGGRASVHCGHDAIYFAGYDSGTHAGVLQRYDLVTQQLEQLAAATRGFKGMAHLKDGILAWGEGQVLNEVEPTQATFPIIFSQWDVATHPVTAAQDIICPPLSESPVLLDDNVIEFRFVVPLDFAAIEIQNAAEEENCIKSFKIYGKGLSIEHILLLDSDPILAPGETRLFRLTGRPEMLQSVRLVIDAYNGVNPALKGIQLFSNSLVLMALPLPPMSCQAHFVEHSSTSSPHFDMIASPHAHLVHNFTDTKDIFYRFTIPEYVNPGFYTIRYFMPSCEEDDYIKDSILSQAQLPLSTEPIWTTVRGKCNNLHEIFDGFLVPGTTIDLRLSEPKLNAKLFIDYLLITPMADWDGSGDKDHMSFVDFGGKISPIIDTFAPSHRITHLITDGIAKAFIVREDLVYQCEVITSEGHCIDSKELARIANIQNISYMTSSDSLLIAGGFTSISTSSNGVIEGCSLASYSLSDPGIWSVSACPSPLLVQVLPLNSVGKLRNYDKYIVAATSSEGAYKVKLPLRADTPLTSYPKLSQYEGDLTRIAILPGKHSEPILGGSFTSMGAEPLKSAILNIATVDRYSDNRGHLVGALNAIEVRTPSNLPNNAGTAVAITHSGDNAISLHQTANENDPTAYVHTLIPQTGHHDYDNDFSRNGFPPVQSVTSISPTKSKTHPLLLTGSFEGRVMLYAASQKRWIPLNLNCSEGSIVKGALALTLSYIIVYGDFRTTVGCVSICVFDLPKWRWRTVNGAETEDRPFWGIDDTSINTVFWTTKPGVLGIGMQHYPYFATYRFDANIESSPDLDHSSRLGEVIAVEIEDTIERYGEALQLNGPVTAGTGITEWHKSTIIIAGVHNITSKPFVWGLCLSKLLASGRESADRSFILDRNLEKPENQDTIISGVRVLSDHALKSPLITDKADHSLVLTGRFDLIPNAEAEGDKVTVAAAIADFTPTSGYRNPHVTWRPLLYSVAGSYIRSMIVHGQAPVGKAGLQRWHIALIALGSLAVLCAFAVLLFFIQKRLKKPKEVVKKYHHEYNSYYEDLRDGGDGYIRVGDSTIRSDSTLSHRALGMRTWTQRLASAVSSRTSSLLRSQGNTLERAKQAHKSTLAELVESLDLMQPAPIHPVRSESTVFAMPHPPIVKEGSPSEVNWATDSDESQQQRHSLRRKRSVHAYEVPELYAQIHSPPVSKRNHLKAMKSTPMLHGDDDMQSTPVSPEVTIRIPVLRRVSSAPEVNPDLWSGSEASHAEQDLAIISTLDFSDTSSA